MEFALFISVVVAGVIGMLLLVAKFHCDLCVERDLHKLTLARLERAEESRDYWKRESTCENEKRQQSAARADAAIKHLQSALMRTVGAAEMVQQAQEAVTKAYSALEGKEE